MNNFTRVSPGVYQNPQGQRVNSAQRPPMPQQRAQPQTQRPAMPAPQQVGTMPLPYKPQFSPGLQFGGGPQGTQTLGSASQGQQAMGQNPAFAMALQKLQSQGQPPSMPMPQSMPPPQY